MPPETDPVLKNSRREAIVIGLAWLAATIYCCGYSYFGYNRAGQPLGVEDVHPIFGMPSWFFWGVIAPWAVCAVFTFVVRRAGSWPTTTSVATTRPSWSRTSAKGGCMDKAGVVHAQPPTLVALVLFTLVSLGLGVVANLVRAAGGLPRKYFLGNRSLGAFAVALTAAVMSGGTFVGFPSLVYSFGWVVGLWIASYMVAPLTVLGVLGKRIGQLSRQTGAITLPDLFRERFGSPALGLLTSLLIIFFLSCNLVAQFKAGGGDHEDRPAVGRAGWVVVGEDIAASPRRGLLSSAWRSSRRRSWPTRPTAGSSRRSGPTSSRASSWPIGVMILLPAGAGGHGGLAGGDLPGDGAGPTPGSPSARGPGGRSTRSALAFSFFVMWAITGMGQPSTMVRLMAFRDSRTLRYSIIYLTIYNVDGLHPPDLHLRRRAEHPARTCERPTR